MFDLPTIAHRIFKYKVKETHDIYKTCYEIGLASPALYNSSLYIQRQNFFNLKEVSEVKRMMTG